MVSMSALCHDVVRTWIQHYLIILWLVGCVCSSNQDNYMLLKSSLLIMYKFHINNIYMYSTIYSGTSVARTPLEP